MEVQPSIRQFFKSRKRPASLIKKSSDEIITDGPLKVFVSEKKILDNELLQTKIVIPSSLKIEEKSKLDSNDCNGVQVESVEELTPIKLEKNIETIERPSTPDNFISVEAPLTPTIRNANPTTPSSKNVLPPRPSTPEANTEVLEAIQKDNFSGLNDLKKKHRLQRKLLSVKKSIDTLKQHGSRLEAIQNALQKINVPEDREEEIISPRKVPVRQRLLFPKEKSTFSPNKQYVSPRKLLLDGPVSVTTSPVKVPAYKRFSDLTAIEEKGTLALPYKYRMLLEIFRTVDTIVSMIHTRGENVTFEKLQSGVQSMIKRTLTHHHLGQIKTILPDAYNYCLEKCHRFGAGSSNPEKYELIIKPILKSSNNETSHCSMNSALLLNRRKEFSRKLMNLTKNYHEKFLLDLMPPVFIEKDKLTRWHPGFELEKVPDIEAQDVPVPKSNTPNASAKTLLERARTLLSCNKRLETAMEKIKSKKDVLENENNVHEDSATEKNSLAVEERLSGTESTSAISIAPALQKAIKGIPQGLLEKIRAKQAAKALESMTQSPTDIKEAIMLSRLPEIARILRVLFVAEKRSILPVEVVIKRISHSFREHLSNTEIRSHLDLLTKHAMDWVKFQNVRNTDFLKLSKEKDLNSVITTLESLAKNKDKSM